MRHDLASSRFQVKITTNLVNSVVSPEERFEVPTDSNWTSNLEISGASRGICRPLMNVKPNGMPGSSEKGWGRVWLFYASGFLVNVLDNFVR